ncbi:hypothetical protein ACQP2U_43340 (plasmid) [Nocardia sp. CA-084685]|uniref:hypothetical protein n=1 Tax=Nocardia sp. CA-084685 TaxID=3239970 RepID=UPI003D971C6D
MRHNTTDTSSSSQRAPRTISPIAAAIIVVTVSVISVCAAGLVVARTLLLIILVLLITIWVRRQVLARSVDPDLRASHAHLLGLLRGHLAGRDGAHIEVGPDLIASVWIDPIFTISVGSNWHAIHDRWILNILFGDQLTINLPLPRGADDGSSAPARLYRLWPQRPDRTTITHLDTLDDPTGEQHPRARIATLAELDTLIAVLATTH